MQNELIKFIKDYESKVVELSREANLAYFNASISGKNEDYKTASDLQLKLGLLHSDKKDFDFINKIKHAGSIKDPDLKRQLVLLHNLYSGNQFDEELHEKIISLSTRIEEKFSTHRAVIDGRPVTDNQIDEILENSVDHKRLESAWSASKEIGKEVAGDVLALVALRNESAKQLGYKNYHEMSLALSEQNAEELESLFDELDRLTRPEFQNLKNKIDEHLSKKFAVSPEDLMPWHYEDKFFQQGPKIFNVDLNKYYENRDIVKITRDYYEAIGLNIDDLLAASDLFEKEGKYQHAYCTDIDRRGDIRVVCNVKPSYRWTNTMLHEFGHAVYDKFINANLPWLLREHAHIFTTEAIAMMFGRLAADPDWIMNETGISADERNKIADDCFNSTKLEQLVFSRWVQVMYRFEKAMYENPGTDLNSLWWLLVEKYQGLKKPVGRNEPDWASKIHVALYPVYYHNYLLGELLASQIGYFLRNKALPSSGNSLRGFSRDKKIGEFLQKEFFSFGASYHWSELIEKAFGEKLTPKYYALEFVSGEDTGRI